MSLTSGRQCPRPGGVCSHLDVRDASRSPGCLLHRRHSVKLGGEIIRVLLYVGAPSSRYIFFDDSLCSSIREIVFTRYVARGCKDVQYITRQYARYIVSVWRSKSIFGQHPWCRVKRGSGVSHNDVKCHARVVLGQQGQELMLQAALSWSERNKHYHTAVTVNRRPKGYPCSGTALKPFWKKGPNLQV